MKPSVIDECTRVLRSYSHRPFSFYHSHLFVKSLDLHNHEWQAANISSSVGYTRTTQSKENQRNWSCIPPLSECIRKLEKVQFFVSFLCAHSRAVCTHIALIFFHEDFIMDVIFLLSPALDNIAIIS